jgi:hypothetical protein
LTLEISERDIIKKKESHQEPFRSIRGQFNRFHFRQPNQSIHEQSTVLQLKMFGMSQQQQVALIQQMAQLQLMNGMQKGPSNLPNGIQPMTFPQMPGYVVIPQNQLAQLQQLQEQALRQQLQQQQDQIKKYENETKQLLNKQQNQTTNQNNKNQKISKISGTNQNTSGGGNQQRSLPKRVLVTRVPNHLKTVETLADVFYPYGIISEIQIFKEKSQIPANLIDIIEKVDPRQSNMPAGQY